MAGWVAGSIETKAISALKLELKLELAGAELGKRLGTSSVPGGLYQDLFIWYNSENSTCRGGSQEFFQVSPG